MNAYNTFENLTMSYDDLVALGRIKAGQDYYGLQGGESRLGRLVEGYQDTLSASDPIFAAYRQQVSGGLAGIENGGIPDDFRRTITENLRASQAQRGIIDSNVGAIEEAVRLAGGTEAIRQQRLAEAQNYFNGVTRGAIGAFMPDLSMFLGAQAQTSAFNQARGQAGNEMLMNQWGLGLDTAGGLIGAGAGMAGGGAPASSSSKG